MKLIDVNDKKSNQKIQFKNEMLPLKSLAEKLRPVGRNSTPGVLYLSELSRGGGAYFIYYNGDYDSVSIDAIVRLDDKEGPEDIDWRQFFEEYDRISDTNTVNKIFYNIEDYAFPGCFRLDAGQTLYNQTIIRHKPSDVPFHRGKLDVEDLSRFDKNDVDKFITIVKSSTTSEAWINHISQCFLRGECSMLVSNHRGEWRSARIYTEINSRYFRQRHYSNPMYNPSIDPSKLYQLADASLHDILSHAYIHNYAVTTLIPTDSYIFTLKNKLEMETLGGYQLIERPRSRHFIQRQW